MSIYKHCPYCIERLSFFSIVKQRLFAKENDALKCSECGSIISTSGNAKVSLLLGGGGIIGFAFGYLISKSFSIQRIALIAGMSVGFVIFLILIYYLAPVKKA
ncbi:MAG: hypothetical protein KZQ97_12615 [Candidatus Thiodiazotropha sp. (ex Dulcina madagascariensis)]|nr:hypothetical protein [Candidatus Thiodiazotropha sp. (ex Dulcina madagascariensis)]